MAGITERNKQRNELAGIGYSLRYIDEWQPKTTLYRHKPSYYVNGEMDSDVGTAVKGVPGSPDYVLRKAKIGLFPWPPSDTCTCKWCKEVGENKAQAREERKVPKKPGPYYEASN